MNRGVQEERTGRGWSATSGRALASDRVPAGRRSGPARPEVSLHHATTALVRRLDLLAAITDQPGETQVAEWMREIGLAVREDAVGNVIGRQDGPGKTLLLGSHLDTVRNAGRFDGPLGVLLPLAALAVLREEGIDLPFAVEVVGFAEEEGVRFASAYLGSKGLTGRLRTADLARRDEEGITIAELLGRRDPQFVLPAPAHRRRDLLGYVETHIEQGPVLEARGLPVGVVSAIAGQTRGKVAFHGKAGHAGTTPMRLRRDALAGAAEWISWVEQYAGARGRGPLVATVGTLTVKPGAANVIPGEAALSLDIRHPVDRVLKSELAAVLAAGQRIARRRRLKFSWEETQRDGAVTCDAALSNLLAASVRAAKITPVRLVSGAGHDGVVMSRLTPIAMLFVRCRGGLSHHPDEYAAPADLAVALRVICDFLKRLAASSNQ